jgi:hypothetical protein
MGIVVGRDKGTGFRYMAGSEDVLYVLVHYNAQRESNPHYPSFTLLESRHDRRVEGIRTLSSFSPGQVAGISQSGSCR